MMRDKFYKLGPYKIIEASGGGLCWESHSDIGSAQTGRCFIEGSILIIGPGEQENPGHLKTEFIEHLDRLPLWKKTKYYCLSHALHKCDTGARKTFDAETRKHLDMSFEITSNKFLPDEIRNRETTFKQPYIDENMIAFKKEMKKILDNVKSRLNFLNRF